MLWQLRQLQIGKIKMDLLSVRDLSFERKGYFAFKHVTFSLAQNQAINIVGDAGSGKTALLETVVGLNEADSGKVTTTPGARISFMPQVETAVIDISVGDYLEQTRQIEGKLAVSSAQLKAMAAFLGMRSLMDRTVKTLSLGAKQRVSFLNAIAKRPNILIMDDPFSFQNSFYAHNMLEIFKDLQDHGSGIVMAAPMRDTITDGFFDTNYLLSGKTLAGLPVDRSAYLMSFKATKDSMAITKEIAHYATTTFNNLIEIRAPYEQKERILHTMLEMNYLFEGMVSLEV